jgi:hypothetical protein
MNSLFIPEIPYSAETEKAVLTIEQFTRIKDDVLKIKKQYDTLKNKQLILLEQ